MVPLASRCGRRSAFVAPNLSWDTFKRSCRPHLLTVGRLPKRLPAVLAAVNKPVQPYA